MICEVSAKGDEMDRRVLGPVARVLSSQAPEVDSDQFEVHWAGGSRAAPRKGRSYVTVFRTLFGCLSISFIESRGHDGVRACD